MEKIKNALNEEYGFVLNYIAAELGVTQAEVIIAGMYLE